MILQNSFAERKSSAAMHDAASSETDQNDDVLRNQPELKNKA